MAGKDGLQTGNGPEQLRPAGFHGGFDLGEGGQGDLLLAGAQGLLLRQGGKEAEPVESILFRDFHSLQILFFHGPRGKTRALFISQLLQSG